MARSTATSTVVFQAVRTGYTQQQTGYASAISLVFFALVLTVSLVQRFLTRDKDLMTASHSAAPRPRRKVTAGTIGAQIGRIVLVLFFAFPIVFMFVSSLKPDEQIFADLGSLRAFLPVGDLSLDNYRATFDKVPAARFLLNSIVISGVIVILGLFINSLAAFGLSRLSGAAADSCSPWCSPPWSCPSRPSRCRCSGG